MIDTFSTIMRLRIAVKTNSVINALRNTPIIKHIIPQRLYQSEALKGILTGYSWFREFISIFTWKILYYMIILGMAGIMADHSGEAGNGVWVKLQYFLDIANDGVVGGGFGISAVFVHFLIVFPLIGMVLNNNVFDADEDTYYAIFLLKLNAKKYMLAQYIFAAVKYVAGTLFVAGVIGGLLARLPFYMVVCYVIYAESIKWIYTGCELKYRAKHVGEEKANTTMMGVRAIITVGMLVFALISILIFGIVLPSTLLVILAVLSLPLAVLAGCYLFTYKDYRRIYKTIVRPEIIIENRNTLKNTNLEAAKQGLELEDQSLGWSGRKDGYAYFNELFMRRHRKLLMKPAIIFSVIIFVAVIIALLMELMLPESRGEINALLLHSMPIFLFVMYAINRGKNLTEAMFANCDSAMLHYRFYRLPKALLGLFAERLKYIIIINLIPAGVLACGLEVLFIVSGGSANGWDYVVIFVSILVMSIFFSTHNVVLYYLFQPYTADSSVRNPVYSIVHYLTYMVCYMSMMELKAPTTVFCTGIIAFSVLYVVIALLVVYHVAPKTFRLRG